MLARLALAALVTASPALAQLDVTLTTRLGGVEANTDALFARPYPGGGAVACFRTGLSGSIAGELVVVRVDRFGAELWRRNIATSSRRGSVDSLTVMPSGSLVLNTQDDNVIDGHIGELISLGADGTTEWTAWPTGVADSDFTGRVAGLSPSGDLYLVGANGGQGTLSALLIDADTGAELWRTDLGGYTSGPSLALLRAATNGTDLFAVFWAQDGYYAARLDSNGQVLYERAIPGNAGFTDPVRAIAAAPDGELVVAIWDLLATVTSLVRLDAAGTQRWRHELPTTGVPVGLALTPEGDSVVAFGRNGGLIQRIDTDGATDWSRAGPPNARRFTSLAQTSDGSFDAVTEIDEPSGSDGIAVARYAASGARLGSRALAPTGPVTGPVSGPVEVHEAVVSPSDAGGGAWATYVTATTQGGDPTDVALARLVPDEIDETVTCVQTTPNSTGAVGRLRLVGAPLASTDDVALVADQLPAGQTVLFLNARQSGFTANPGGSAGDLCLGSPLARYTEDLVSSSASGRAVLQLDLAETPNGPGTAPILAGETWFFQAWHRDVPAGSNLTSAVSLTFQ